MVWCKHGFQRQRSNFYGKFADFQRLWRKKLIKEFPNKGWRLWGLNKHAKSFKKLALLQDEAAALKVYRISRFSIAYCNISVVTVLKIW